MNVRTAGLPAAAVLLVATLAGCTQTIAGTPGPRPTLSGSGDFPTGSDTPTDTASDDPTASAPSTDDPTSTAEPTDLPTDGDSASVQTLCSRLDYANQQGQGVDPDVLRRYTKTMILLWGVANSNDDPYSTVDAATTAACPDIRTTLLGLLQLPDLKSTDS